MGRSTKGLCYPVAADFSTASSIRLGEEAEEGTQKRSQTSSYAMVATSLKISIIALLFQSKHKEDNMSIDDVGSKVRHRSL